MPKRGPSRRLKSKKRDQKKRLNRIFRMLKFVLRIVRAVLCILSIWEGLLGDSKPPMLLQSRSVESNRGWKSFASFFTKIALIEKSVWDIKLTLSSSPRSSNF